ncbi:DUF748 domain-containing protein [Alcanivorax jadensis]|uniref:DUF748 domain-containing protein n=1 Tax=Alcanivorax jadensis TaxID=64988 RepID=UPI0026F115C9|nr:DUF748 domain-containing protein [Alcanivorax jadensis]
MKVLQAWKSSSWKMKTLIILASLYLLYVLLGFFLAPGLVRDNARQALADLTGRQVIIDEVKINPLVLSATVNGFSIQDDQTEVLLGFNQLYVNFQLSSLFRWSWHFDEVMLDALTVRAQRNPGNAFSFDDVLAHIQEQLAKTPEEEAPEPEQEEPGLPAISIASLSLTNGDLRFTEATGDEPEKLVLPLAFTVSNFSTKGKDENSNDYAIRLEGPDGGVLDWQGNFEFTPFIAQGHLSVEKVDLVPLARLLKNEVRFTVPSGELDVETAYHFDAQPQPKVVLSNGQVVLRQLQLLKPGEDSPSVSLPQVRVEGVALDSLAQEVTIPRVTVTDPGVGLVLNEEGIDLATLFLPADREAAEERVEEVKEKAEQAAQKVQEGKADWIVRLDTLQVDGSGLRFTDRTLQPAQTLTLSDGQLTLKNLIIGEPATFTWEGSSKIQQSGTLTHSGEGNLTPFSIEAQAGLKGLPLAPFSPWLEREAPLALASGVLSLDSRASVKGENADVTASANASLENFSLLENGEPLLKINQGSVTDLSLTTAEQTVRIGEVGLTGMDLANRVDAQGRDVATRIQAGMSSGETGGSRSVSEQGQSEPWQVTVDRVRLVGSQIRHEDLSLSPNFRIGLYQLSGNLRNLDTRPGRRATIDLNAQVDRYAPLSVKGSLTAEPLFTDLKVSLKNYEMTGLTPYTGQYLGYKVEKGQLGVTTGVSIEKNQLSSDTDILANEFYLGEKVPSEQAVKAPVKLGLSVLRNRSGEITLPVNMAGNLDDPSFSVGGMVLKVLSNIVVKAATAPFSVLSALAGGKNLENIAFSPGEAEIQPDTASALDALAKVLNERPQLRVGLIGTTNAEDRTALAAQAIGREVADEDWLGIDNALQEKKWRRKLIRRYESSTDRDVESLVSNPLPEDDEQRETLLARAAWESMLSTGAKGLDRAQLTELARLRGENAKAALVQTLGIEQNRVFLNETNVDGNVAGLTLTLEK